MGKYLGEAGTAAIVEKINGKLSAIVLNFEMPLWDGGGSIDSAILETDDEKRMAQSNAIKSAITQAADSNGIIIFTGDEFGKNNGIMLVQNIVYYGVKAGYYWKAISALRNDYKATFDPQWNYGENELKVTQYTADEVREMFNNQ